MQRVELEDQVVSFLRSLSPEPRQQIRAALRSLESGQGDLKPLEGELEGFFRLRVGSYRVIFLCISGAQGPLVRCVYAERRSVIYELFAELLRES